MNANKLVLKGWTLLSLIVMSSFVSNVIGQDDSDKGIQFFEGTWQETLDKAKAEDKMIFVDCYTSWCGPCKKLAKEVFPDEELGKVFNEQFISVKIDMEKGEGVEIREQLKVKAFPTMVFTDAKGTETHRVVGMRSAEQLIAEAEKANSGNGFGVYQKRYEDGDRDEKFLYEYIGMLKAANKKDDLDKVAREMLMEVKPQLWLQDKNWSLINNYVLDAESDIIQYVHQYRHRFMAMHGQATVERKLKTVFTNSACKFVVEEEGQKTLDEEAYAAYIQMLKDIDVKEWETIKLDADMRYTLQLAQWDDHVRIVNQKIEEMGEKLHPSLIWNYAMRINQLCDDDATRAEAVKWCELAIKLTDSEKAVQSYERTLEALQQPMQQK